MNRFHLAASLAAVAGLLLIGALWQRFHLNAAGPPPPATYSASQTTAVTAVATALSQDPVVHGLLAKSSCPTQTGDYNIDPKTLGDALMGLIGGNKDPGCSHVIIDGKITPQVYWMSLSRAVLVVTGHLKVTIEYYDSHCQLQTITIPDFTFQLAFSIKNNGTVGGIVPLPTGKPICIINLPSRTIHYEIGQLDKDKCCHLGGPGTSTQSTTQ